MSGISSPSLLQELFPTTGSGTDAAAGATTVDSVVVPALGANDLLIIKAIVESITQQTAGALIYDVTDASTICSIHAGAAIAAGAGSINSVEVQLRQGSTTAVLAVNQGGTIAGGNAFVANNNPVTIAAGWTTGFTMGLRHTGVTAGGTFKYRWRIYILRG